MPLSNSLKSPTNTLTLYGNNESLLQDSAVFAVFG